MNVQRMRMAALRYAVCAAVLAPALRAQDTALVKRTAAGVLVDFQDVDLREVITALAEAGNLNVTYGDIPAKRVTMRLRQAVPRAEIAQLLRSLATSNGLRVVEEGSVLRFEVADAAGSAATRAMGERSPPVPRRLYVYFLKHARAVRLSQTLQAVFGSGVVAAGGNEMRSRPLSEYLRDQSIRPYAPSDTQPPAGPRAMGNQVEIGGSLRADVQIVPDETTNSLIIRATPEDYEIVRQAIEIVDLRPLQVLIEVLIAEVRLTEAMDVGTSGSATKTAGGNTTGVELKGAAAGDFITKITRGGQVSVNLAISALASRGSVRIVSRPLLFAQNNLEAKILVGSQRPFVQVSRSLPTDAGVRDQVVQYRDVGTSLTIIPTINPDGYVTMQVTQEVSSATNETQFGAPVISTREALTHLFVKDGQTAVFGGLVDQQREKTRSGVPVLMSIPLLGRLFSSSKWSTTNNELYLFLTPHVVQTDEDLNRLRREIDKRSPEAQAPSVLPKKP